MNTKKYKSLIMDDKLIHFDNQDNLYEVLHMVKSISGYAFAESGIKSVYIPANIEHIDMYVFEDCKHLKSIVISDANRNITRIPEGFAKGCERLTSVQLGPSVYHIENKAFEGCKLLQTVEMTLYKHTVIEPRAFEGCLMGEPNIINRPPIKNQDRIMARLVNKISTLQHQAQTNGNEKEAEEYREYINYLKHLDNMFKK